MAAPIDDRIRRVVPRWRTFNVSCSMGLLDGADTSRLRRPLQPAPGEIEELRASWRRRRSLEHAAELVDAAVVLGDPELAIDAAEFLLQEGGLSEASLMLARHVTLAESDHRPLGDVPEFSRSVRYARIARFRRTLRRWPDNPLAWVDLAREYSNLGQIRPAGRALQVGLGLAPDDRHVVRSASRFYLHIRDPERAHHVVSRSSATREDPWLLAAEIVAASVSKKGTGLVKLGNRMLASGRFHPRHVSELAGALGTLEHQSGARRKVRRYFRQALIDPTENTVAQAAWLARRMPQFELPPESLRVPRAFEAQSWQSAVQGDHDRAVELSWEWLKDEPYSTRSALFGSWIASMAIADFNEAERIVEAARLANPEDPHLLAQLFYCQASRGEIDSAESMLPRLETAIENDQGHRSPEEWEVMLHADRGLLAYRRGHVEEGRRLYHEAMRVAKSNKLREAHALALLNYAREEARSNPLVPVEFGELQKAVDVFPRAVRGIVEYFLKQIPQVRIPSLGC